MPYGLATLTKISITWWLDANWKLLFVGQTAEVLLLLYPHKITVSLTWCPGANWRLLFFWHAPAILAVFFPFLDACARKSSRWVSRETCPFFHRILLLVVLSVYVQLLSWIILFVSYVRFISYKSPGMSCKPWSDKKYLDILNTGKRGSCETKNTSGKNTKNVPPQRCYAFSFRLARWNML